MKIIQLNKILVLSLIFILIVEISSCCFNQIHGSYYIDDETRKYFPDTTIQSFTMIDKNGISDCYYIETQYGDSHFLSISQWDKKNYCGDAYKTERFNIEYVSTINNYRLTIYFSGDIGGSTLSVQWNYNDMISYNFKDKDFQSDIKPNIEFLEEMEILGVTYTDIIVIDYENAGSQINSATPFKIYLSGNVGPVKFEMQNGIEIERNP